jgi:hypothetical protein
MKMLWQTETNSIVCHWSEAGKRMQYYPSWMQDSLSDAYENVLPSVPDFARLSSFGGANWYSGLESEATQIRK